jgi:FkbM family methyltransferase
MIAGLNSQHLAYRPMRKSFIQTISPYLKVFAFKKYSQIRRRFIGPSVQALLVRSRNGLLLVDPDDCTLGRRLAKDGEYSWNEIERLRSYVRQSDDILIVGAHVGTIAIPIAANCRSVTAIGANPCSFSLLNLNLQINGVTNIHAVNVAASDKTEEIEFLMNRVNSGGSKRMPMIRSYLYFSDSPKITTVHAKLLDEMFPKLIPAVIFMDIEGSEYFAIKGDATAPQSDQGIFHGVSATSFEEHQWGHSI